MPVCVPASSEWRAFPCGPRLNDSEITVRIKILFRRRGKSNLFMTPILSTMLPFEHTIAASVSDSRCFLLDSGARGIV